MSWLRNNLPAITGFGTTSVLGASLYGFWAPWSSVETLRATLDHGDMVNTAAKQAVNQTLAGVHHGRVVSLIAMAIAVLGAFVTIPVATRWY